MAASARICCGGGGSACAVRCDRRPMTTARSSCVVPMTNRRKLCEIGKISMTMDDFISPSTAVKIDRTNIGERKRGGSVVSREKLDVWLRDSVVEIVKNLRESPLLVHLYAEANGGLTTTATNPEAEDWPAMEGRWDRGEERTPEGVIFVEKLADDDVADREGDYEARVLQFGSRTRPGYGVGTGTAPVHLGNVPDTSQAKRRRQSLNGDGNVGNGDVPGTFELKNKCTLQYNIN